MNAYISDRIAREHADRLMADAAAARRARLAVKGRRSATRRTRSRTADRRPAAVRPGTAAAAQFVTRPFTAVRTWLLAGQL